MFRTGMLAGLLATTSAAATAVATAANAGAVGGAATLTGTVSTSSHAVLPSESLIHVQLLDVPRPGAAGTVVAETSLFAGSERVSVPFEIPYDPSAIVPGHRYAVRAVIASGGVERFASAAGQPVLPEGGAARIDLVLVAAGAPRAAAAQNGAAHTANSSPAAPPAPSQAAGATATEPGAGPPQDAIAGLESTHWKLTDLAGTPSATVPDVTPAYIEFDAVQKRIAAIGGCNRLMGSYVLQGTSLSISAGGMTMMACPDPLGKQELAFTDALRATKAYRIAGTTLELLDGAKVLARFTATAK